MHFFRALQKTLVIVYLVFLGSVSCAQNTITRIPDFPAAVERVLPSVVRIIGETTQEKIKSHTTASTVNIKNKVYSVGSGFIVSADGKIVTANHVIAPMMGDIIVVQQIGQKTKEHKASVLASDKNADVAILHIKGDAFPHVTLRDMGSSARRGEDIGFIGYPLLSSYSLVHKGIISAKVIKSLQENLEPRLMFVINAIVNNGNSGGPLFLGKDGTVIGLVNARKGANVEKRKVKLPDKRPKILLGGIDGLALSVEMYNKNLELIGEVSQFGIGYALSIQYAIKLLEEIEKQ